MVTADTPVASGSQGVSDQQNSKKQKPLRPSEANSEAALTSGLLNGQDVGFVVGANKLTRLIGARDSHRRVRLNKVKFVLIGNDRRMVIVGIIFFF